MPVGDEPAAPGERRHDGQDVGDVDGREPDRAQPEREALRGVGVGEVGVDPAGALRREAERLDGAPAVDRLAGGARHRRVRRALPEVAGGRVAEVPARPDEQDRRSDETGQRGDRAHPDRGGDDEERGHARDRRLGNREPDRARERVDVGGRARDEVADPGPLDRRERQREDAAHEVVAQLGEHPLREHERRAAGEEREDGLGDEEDRQDRDDPVDLRRVDLRLQPLDERAEQRRPDEPGGGGERVEDEDADHRAPVAARELERLLAHLLRVGDGEEVGHAASPRVTTSR